MHARSTFQGCFRSTANISLTSHRRGRPEQNEGKSNFVLKFLNTSKLCPHTGCTLATPPDAYQYKRLPWLPLCTSYALRKIHVWTQLQSQMGNHVFSSGFLLIFFSFQNHFIHSFILVQSFTKYVLDHIQSIGNDRNVQSVPEKNNRNSGPLPLPPAIETWNILSSIWSENNLFFSSQRISSGPVPQSPKVTRSKEKLNFIKQV